MSFFKVVELISDKISGEWGTEDVEGNGVYVLRTTNFTNSGNIDYKNVVTRIIDEKKVSKKKLNAGDIIIEKSGGSPKQPVGRVVFFKGDKEGTFLCNNFTSILRPNNNVFPKYLFYSLFENYKDRKVLKYQNKTTGIINLKLDKYLEEKIPLPPLAEQTRIAAILDKADAIRRKQQKAIELCDQFLKALFIDMFGDPVTNPKGWEVKKLGELGQLDRGKSKHRPRNEPKLLGGIDGPYPLVQTGDVANCGGYLTTYKQTYTEMGLQQSRMWPAGTLCITIAANIANTGILTFDSCFPDSVVGFTPNELTGTIYIQYWMGFLQQILEENAPAAAQKNINLKILRNLDVPVAPLNLQNKFAEIVKKTEANKAKLQKSLDRLNDNFNALSQKAFKGEL